MPTLIDNLNLINSYKSDIKSAIENKGVDMTGVSFGSYADKIGEIQTGGTFVTETLSVSVNNTYYPGQGVDGFSQVIVDVPQSVEGYTEKEITEETYAIYNLSNSASFVHRNVFEGNMNLLTVNLPNASYVGNEAFRYCSNLTSVEMATCKNIYSSAFNECTSISYLSLPEVTNIWTSAFYSCTGLISLYLPKLESLSSAAFHSCKNLQTVNLPEVKTISANAFNKCTSLNTLDLPKCKEIFSFVFQDCIYLSQINLPECLKLYNQVFQNVKSLGSIYLPKCSYIDQYCFDGCTSLSYINLPMCVLISSYAFNNLSNSLESFSLPIVMSLGTYVFGSTNGYNNYIFSYVDMPYLVTTANGAFAGFKSLTKVNVPVLSNLTAKFNFDFNSRLEVSYGNRIYVVPTYSANTFSSINTASCSIYVDAAMYDSWVAATGWASLSAAFVSFGDPDVPMISYSNGVIYGKTWRVLYGVNTYLGVNAYNINEIDLPECRVIDNGTFSGYTSLTSVNLPECEVLTDNVFYNCTSLEYVNIPKCKYIGQDALRSARYLSSITLIESNVCYLQTSYTFSGTSITAEHGSIFVPASLVDAYKSANNWSYFKNRIFPIQEP